MMWHAASCEFLEQDGARAAAVVAAARERGLLLTCGLYGNVIRPDADLADGLEAGLSVG